MTDPVVYVNGEPLRLRAFNITVEPPVEIKPPAFDDWSFDFGAETVEGNFELRWGESDADPMSDLKRWIDEFNEASTYGPDTLILSEWHWRAIIRRGMSKRQFRRWRGKRKALLRAERIAQ